MGGTVSASSSALGGLAVTVHLRQAPPPEERGVSQSGRRTHPRRRGRRRGPRSGRRAASTRTVIAVTEAGDAATARRRWDAERADLVLLDLGLPDEDGATIIRRIRRESATPILILTARADEHDKVAALDAGADDYVTKPFGMDELRARVGRLLRRAAGPAADPPGSSVSGRSRSTSARAG